MAFSIMMDNQSGWLLVRLEFEGALYANDKLSYRSKRMLTASPARRSLAALAGFAGFKDISNSSR